MPDPANDPSLPYRFTGPDEDGIVWLDWNGEGPATLLNLGDRAEFQSAYIEWLVRAEEG